ncbi:hypothetical protein C8J56DRAFT_543266 [Mycena floridula]|nr:hypothetical protein C8J56DRAFT_543266 [Mycena floridula]
MQHVNPEYAPFPSLLNLQKLVQNLPILVQIQSPTISIITLPLWLSLMLLDFHPSTLPTESWGTLSPSKDNVILLHTGLSASSHAASTASNPSEGWWEKFIGPNKPLGHQPLFYHLHKRPGRLLRLDGSILHRSLFRCSICD